MVLKRKLLMGSAEIELDEKAVEARMYEYLQFVPAAAKPLGIQMKNGKANEEDVARVAKDRLFVKIRPTLGKSLANQ